MITSPIIQIVILVVALLELAIIIYLLFIKKKSVIREVSFDFNQQINELKQKINEIKNNAEKSNKKNKTLENKIAKLEKKLQLLEEINKDLSRKKDELTAQKYKLEKLQKRKDELFAIAIHDIKNPLSAIKSYLELLESYDTSVKDQFEIFESMMQSSNQILNLTNEISEIIVREDEEYSLNLQEISLKEIIDSVCNQNKGYAESKKIKIINKSSMNVPKVKVDPEKLKEVVDNLVNNAIKYGPEKTNVQIITYFTKTSVTFEISDDGVGLSQEDQNQLFKKGQKLTPKPTGNEVSTGLGLWIVKTIIEEHEGKVYCNSKLGRGTTFGFELAISEK